LNLIPILCDCQMIDWRPHIPLMNVGTSDFQPGRLRHAFGVHEPNLQRWNRPRGMKPFGRQRLLLGSTGLPAATTSDAVGDRCWQPDFGHHDSRRWRPQTKHKEEDLEKDTHGSSVERSLIKNTSNKTDFCK